MCFDQAREKRNREARRSFGPRVEANLQSFVRRATAPREMAHRAKNDREQSVLSKKSKSTSGPTTDDGQASACARKYTKLGRFEHGIPPIHSARLLKCQDTSRLAVSRRSPRVAPPARQHSVVATTQPLAATKPRCAKPCSKTSRRRPLLRQDWPHCNRKRFGSTGLLPMYSRRSP